MSTEIQVVSRYRSISSKIIWKINDFTLLNSQDETYSDVFTIGDYKWRVWVYPKGENRVFDHLSLFLCPIELPKSVDTEFSFEATSLTDLDSKVRKGGNLKFPAGTSLGWGYPRFMPLSELHDPAKGYIVNDCCLITVEVSCTTKEEVSDWDGIVVKECEPADKVSEFKRPKIKC